jgi:hypothetical protein
MRQRRSLHIDKGNNRQEEIIIVNTYAQSIGSPNYITQTLLDIKINRPQNNNGG